MFHFNLKYLCCAITCIPIGLASRECAHLLPPFLALYAGDILWAVLVYFLIRSFVTDPKSSVISALLFSFAIEFLQLYNAPWIGRIRNTILGGLVLGFGFLWSDLLCYATGIALAAIVDYFLLHPDRNRKN